MILIALINVKTLCKSTSDLYKVACTFFLAMLCLIRLYLIIIINYREFIKGVRHV